MLKWSEIDYKRFHLKTAKLTIDDQHIDIAPIIEIFQKENGRLFIIRCNSGLNDVIHQLHKTGFFLTDTMLTYSINVKDSNLSKKYTDKFQIVNALADDSEILGEMAQSSFAGYRSHYHKNPFLDNQLCDQVYIDWARNLVIKEGMSDVVFIAKSGNKSVGFASLKVENGEAKAGLLGVIPEYRGLGISHILHQERFQWCKSNSINKIAVETSLSNINYITILSDLGFKLHSSKHVFHLVHNHPE